MRSLCIGSPDRQHGRQNTPLKSRLKLLREPSVLEETNRVFGIANKLLHQHTSE
jgi:hypothetical protein